MGVTRINGRKIYYEDSENGRQGIKHLREDLQDEETEPLFSHARQHGSASFEDDHERQFSVVKKPNGTYELQSR